MACNISVTYAEGARELARQLIGCDFTDEELAAAVGALDGAIVNVRISRAELLAEVSHPYIKLQKRRLRRDATGQLYVYNEKFIKATGAPALTGLQSFAAQVVGAKALGATRFETFAQGYLNDTEYNGYLVWALFRYDAPLTVRDRKLLPSELAGAQTVNDVIERGGREWWRLHGDARLMRFDLSDDSRMMKILRARLKEKGLLKE
jgi:hypothetical protein